MVYLLESITLIEKSCEAALDLRLVNEFNWPFEITRTFTEKEFVKGVKEDKGEKLSALRLFLFCSSI